MFFSRISLFCNEMFFFMFILAQLCHLDVLTFVKINNNKPTVRKYFTRKKVKIP